MTPTCSCPGIAVRYEWVKRGDESGFWWKRGDFVLKFANGKYAHMFVRANSKSNDLLQIIKGQQWRQWRLVERSTGTKPHERFKEEDLTKFLQSGVPALLTDEVKRSIWFLPTVQAIERLPADQRESLLESARHTAGPIWEELRLRRLAFGLSGQTLAGQKADLAIANAIVDAAVELMRYNSNGADAQ